MKIAVPNLIEPVSELGWVHFVGIGGAGLSAIARIMHQLGIRVSGSDAVDSDTLRALAAEGIEVFTSHRAENIAEADTVVVSTAVDENNPEVLAAQAKGVRLWPRSAGLQSVLTGRTVVAVAGTHGKTTTTSLIALALKSTARDIGFAIGAQVKDLGTNAAAGRDPLIVVEADESDGAFLVYEPSISVVTNVDADHLDQWGSVEAYEAAFGQFISRTRDFLVVNADDGRALDLARQHARCRVVSAGFSSSADIRGTNVEIDGNRSRCDVYRGQDKLGTLELQVPGEHYLLDALLALACAIQTGMSAADAFLGFASYSGAERRMQRIGEARGIAVYDTYAHHPVEISADLAAARNLGSRVLVAFQPHLVSRTRIFGEQMGAALNGADRVLVTDIYLARELADPNVDTSVITDQVESTKLLRAHALAEIPDTMVAEAQSGDVIVTMGAGDITTVAPMILQALND